MVSVLHFHLISAKWVTSAQQSQQCANDREEAGAALMTKNGLGISQDWEYQSRHTEP